MAALKSDGTVWTSGLNHGGQLGDGTYGTRYSPVQVINLTGIVKIESGNGVTVALKSDGTVWTWGSNNYGELGDGTTTWRIRPGQVHNLTSVIDVSVKSGHVIAIKSDGTLWGWGYNGYGQLGDGTTTRRLTPVPVAGVSGVSAVSVGHYHTLALKSDGTLWAWGGNTDGQLGDGTTMQRLTPAPVGGIGGAEVLHRVTRISAGGFSTLVLRDINLPLSGTVTLQGLEATAPAQTVMFTFRNTEGTPLFTRTAQIDASGAFFMTIPEGNYTVHLSAPRYLGRNITLNGYGSSATQTTILRVGDANEDNAVDIADLVLLIVSPAGV